ncbi:hypothetical protein V5799_032638 [Amblyomma americanum]|uniref:Peptidase M13 N-terminal domain-containing protein n=1 Tax=Amblyomma americanum TaxID=6943 RepID=A0AAQ4DQL5_AMBAM
MLSKWRRTDDTATERVLAPGKSLAVGLGVATVVSLNCFLCVLVARKAFLLPPYAVEDADDDGAPTTVFHAAAADRRPFGRRSSSTAGPTAPLCSTPAVCERLDAYLGDTLDHDKDPCDDFYGYVCSRPRSHHRLAEAALQARHAFRQLAGLQRHADTSEMQKRP